MKTLKQLLIELEACPNSIKWVQDKSIEQSVSQCNRADWLLWLAEEIGCDYKKIVLCGGLCANTVRHLMNDCRSVTAVDTAIDYGNGQTTKEKLAVARENARDVLNGEEMDMCTASRAAASAAINFPAWAAANNAAGAAAINSKSDFPSALIFEASIKDMAEIVRPIIADELIQKVNNLLQ